MASRWLFVLYTFLVFSICSCAMTGTEQRDTIKDVLKSTAEILNILTSSGQDVSQPTPQSQQKEE